MRIAFDLRPVGTEHAGPRAIVEGWHRGWATAFPQDDVVLVGFDGSPSLLELVKGKLGLVSSPANSWVVLSSPTVLSAFGGSRRRVPVCHDFRHVEQPESFTLLQRTFRWVIWNRAFGRAVIVLANSDETRMQISKRVPQAFVRVLSSAPSVTGIEMGGDRRSRSGLLAVAHRANKPPSRAVKVWHDAFPDERRRPPLTVLAGELVSNISPEPGLTVLSKVSGEAYKRLIRESIAVIYLSDFEGLGLPCFEAMAAGTPLLTSDLPIFRDNLGENYAGLADGSPHLVLRGLVEHEEAWDSCRSQLQIRGVEQDQILAQEIGSLRDELLALDC
jgi:hypothetical protein